MTLRIIMLVLTVLALAVPATAQTPTTTVEDALRECRVYAGAAVSARTRQELEAARAIAERDKEIERLRAELAKKEAEKQ